MARVHPMIRDSALESRPLTPRRTDRSDIAIEDAQSARGGDAKTNMADSVLIAVNDRDESTGARRLLHAPSSCMWRRQATMRERQRLMNMPSTCRFSHETDYPSLGNATSGRKARKCEQLELRDETDQQATRRREAVAAAKERIELFVRCKVRRGRDLPQVEELLCVRLEPGLVVEDVQQTCFE